MTTGTEITHTQVQSPAGWSVLTEALTEALALVAEAAPDPATAAEGEGYVYRVLSGQLSDLYLRHLFTVDGLSRALPVKGAPNPDYLLSNAGLDPAQTYQLRVSLNASERVGVGVYRIGSGGEVLECGYRVLDRQRCPEGEAVTLCPEGEAVTLSLLPQAQATAGAGEDPFRLPLPEDARILLIRTLHRDPQGQPAQLALSGPLPPLDLPLSRGGHEAALTRAAAMLLTGVKQFIHWSQVCSQQPNSLLRPHASIADSAQGDPGTDYWLGYFELEAGEWLQVRLPAGLRGYWSLHAYNHWGERLPAAGQDDRQAVADEVGTVTLNLGPAMPAVLPNRLDTLGRHRGVLVLRLIGSQLSDERAPLVVVCREGARGEEE